MRKALKKTKLYCVWRAQISCNIDNISSAAKPSLPTVSCSRYTVLLHRTSSAELNALRLFLSSEVECALRSCHRDVSNQNCLHGCRLSLNLNLRASLSLFALSLVTSFSIHTGPFLPVVFNFYLSFSVPLSLNYFTFHLLACVFHQYFPSIFDNALYVPTTIATTLFLPLISI